MPTATSQDITKVAGSDIETVTFLSRSRALRLVRKPKQTVVLQSGLQATTEEGQAYSFEPNGRLEVYVGQHRMATGPLEFDPETSEYRPAVEDAVDWLRRHDALNRFFWEEGREPDRPLPTEEDVFEAILTAVTSLDAAPIEVILENERATHNRHIVLVTAERALVKLRSALADGAAGPLRPDGSQSARVAADYAHATPAAAPSPGPAARAAAMAEPAEVPAGDPLAEGARLAREAEVIAQARAEEQARVEASLEAPLGVEGAAEAPQVDPAALAPSDPSQDFVAGDEPAEDPQSAALAEQVRAAGAPPADGEPRLT